MVFRESKPGNRTGVRFRNENFSDGQYRGSYSAIKKVIIELNSEPNKVHQELEDFISTFGKEINDHQVLVADTIINTYLKKPYNICVYSTLLGLLNLNNSQFGEFFLQTIHNRIESMLQLDSSVIVIKKLVQVNLLLQFLADITNSNVIEVKSALNYFELLIDQHLCPDLESSDSLKNNDASGSLIRDYFLASIIKSIGWLGEISFSDTNEVDDCKSHLTRIISKLDDIISERIAKAEKHIKLFRIWNSTKQFQHSNLECLWKAFINLRDNCRWRIKAVVRPYYDFNELKDAEPHKFPQIEFPSFPDDFSVDCINLLFPKCETMILIPKDVLSQEGKIESEDSTVVAYFPNIETFDRQILEQNIENLIKSNIRNVSLCFSTLSQWSIESKHSLESLFVDFIMRDVLRLPSSTLPLLFSASLIARASTHDSNVYSPIISSAISSILSKLNLLGPILIERFSEWCSLYISNTGPENFQFYEFDDPNKLNQNDMITLFLIDLFERLKIIYYNRNLKDYIPSNLINFYPTLQPHNYRYNKEYGTKLPGFPITRLIVQKLAGSGTLEVDQICNELYKSIEDYNLEEDVESPFILMDTENDNKRIIKIDASFQTIIYGGRDIIAKSKNLINKYSSFLELLVTSELDELAAIYSVFDFWNTNRIRCVSTLMHLFDLKIIKIKTIIRFVFNKLHQMKNNSYDPTTCFLLFQIFDTFTFFHIDSVTNAHLKLAAAQKIKTNKNKYNEDSDSKEDEDDIVASAELDLDRLKGSLEEVMKFSFECFGKILRELAANQPTAFTKDVVSRFQHFVLKNYANLKYDLNNAGTIRDSVYWEAPIPLLNIVDRLRSIYV